MFLKGLVTGDFGMMRQAVQNQMQNMRNLISNIVNALPNTFKNGLVKVRSALSSGLNSALRVVTGMASRFLNAGKNIVTSIADGIRNAIDAVTGAISNVTSKIRAFLPFSPAEEGPLSELDKLDFEGPISDSISRGERTIKDKMADMLGAIHPSVNMNVGGYGATTRTVSGNAYVSQSNENKVVGLLQELVQAVREGKNIIMDDREVGRIIEPYVTETQKRNKKVRESFA